ncbi:MAG: hypothetical protein JST89_26540, partial [Cyanobacteria bacterium SZAS-4]|nr:hypothetical protein [Cyanobacteria bacterium SZAS-4]
MPDNDDSVSFYFFDIDDNLFFLPTKLYLWNAETKKEREVSSGEYTTIHDQLGRSGEWQEWSVREGFTYRDFRDAPNVFPAEQAFCKVLLEAVKNGSNWKGPSWPLLEHAAKNQRPVVFITARGHAPDTIAAGFDALAEMGILEKPLSILCIFTVSNPDVQKTLGITDPNTTVPSMKKMAIKAAVELGLEKYGKTPPHRFGISD